MNCSKHIKISSWKKKGKFLKKSKQMPYFYTPKSQDQGYKSVEGCDSLSVPELFIEEKLHSTCSTSWVTVGVEISLFTIYKPFYNVNLIIWVNTPIDKIYVKDDKENCCPNRSGFCIRYCGF